MSYLFASTIVLPHRDLRCSEFLSQDIYSEHFLAEHFVSVTQKYIFKLYQLKHFHDTKTATPTMT